MEGKKPSRGTAILIHGFTGVPENLYPLADRLRLEGYEAIVPRLAGHTRKKKDMKGHTHEEWVQSILDAYDEQKKEGKRPMLVGYSMGALIAIQVARRRDVDAMVLVCPPVFELNFRNILGRLSEEFWYALSGYVMLPKCATRKNIKELKKLRAECIQEMEGLTCRITVVQSKDDDCANPKSASYIMEHTPKAEKTLCWIERGHHEVFEPKNVAFAHAVGYVCQALDTYFTKRIEETAG